MPRNHYLVLGVSDSATADEVRAAFRQRSKELHPDVFTGNAGSAPFLELQEAYAVLGNPSRRREYDLENARRIPAHSIRREAAPLSAVPLRATRPDVTLRPQAAVERHPAGGNISLLHDFARFQPSFDELFERLWSNFGEFARAKGETIESLNVEVVASPEEARRGGVVRIGIPARTLCPTCHGYGAAGGHACWHCGGDGALIVEQSVAVAYPAGLREGHLVRVPLGSFGIENFYLTVVFRISSASSR